MFDSVVFHPLSISPRCPCDSVLVSVWKHVTGPDSALSFSELFDSDDCMHSPHPPWPPCLQTHKMTVTPTSNNTAGFSYFMWRNVWTLSLLVITHLKTTMGGGRVSYSRYYCRYFFYCCHTYCIYVPKCQFISVLKYICYNQVVLNICLL